MDSLKLPSGYIPLMQRLFPKSVKQPFNIKHISDNQWVFINQHEAHSDYAFSRYVACDDEASMVVDGLPTEVYVPVRILLVQGRVNAVEHLFSAFYGKRCYVRIDRHRTLAVVDTKFNLLAVHNLRGDSEAELFWLEKKSTTDFSSLASALTKGMFQGEIISRNLQHAQEYLTAVVSNLMAYIEYDERHVTGVVKEDGYYIRYTRCGELYQMDFVNRIPVKVRHIDDKEQHSHFLNIVKPGYMSASYIPFSKRFEAECFIYEGYGLCQPFSYYVTDVTGKPLCDFKANRVNLFDKLLGARPHIR